MGSIFLQIGQCGCQIGKQLNPKLSQSYYSTRIHGINGSKKVHAIMLDTEPKVLKPLLDKTPNWMDPSNIKCFEYGRGNNWSYGYLHQIPSSKTQSENEQLNKMDPLLLNRKQKNNHQQFVEGHKQFSHNDKYINEMQNLSVVKQLSPKKQIKQKQMHTVFQEKVLLGKYIRQNKQISEYALDKIRKQLDHTDCPLSINVICSLGGGTGSGLGTKLIQNIYQQFSIDIFAHVILPNKSGQTPLQIYNCALSLASIQEHSTAIFTYQNDNMIKTFLEQKKQNTSNIPHKLNDIDLINRQIAQMQARLFTINDIEGFPRFYHDIVSDCILSSQLKYIQMFGSSAKFPNFDEGFQNICHQLRVNNQQTYQIQGIQNKREKCIASSLLIWSNGLQKKQNFMKDHHYKKLKTICNNHMGSQFHHVEEYITKSKMNKDKQNIESVFLMNHSNIVRYLEYLSISGRKKMQYKAYLWHYKYADLEQAFNKIDTVIDQYNYI